MSLLFTDLYELTMAQGYWVHGRAEEEAVFHLAYRDAPPEAACVLACGLEPLLRWLEDFAPTADDLSYLASLTAPDGTRLFQAGFLDALASLQFTADVDAVPEGTAVFPGGPLLRVQGPLMQAQMIETAALNQLGYASLVMTQAAQVCAAAQGDPVLEFGLRRAQGPDGGHTASRAAYLGGCTATSNLVAAQRWNIPVRGTHAHSWVMSFDDEQDAFAAYLASAPNNSILLVDTYDVATGLDRAIAAGQHHTTALDIDHRRLGKARHAGKQLAFRCGDHVANRRPADFFSGQDQPVGLAGRIDRPRAAGAREHRRRQGNGDRRHSGHNHQDRDQSDAAFTLAFWILFHADAPATRLAMVSGRPSRNMMVISMRSGSTSLGGSGTASQ